MNNTTICGIRYTNQLITNGSKKSEFYSLAKLDSSLLLIHPIFLNQSLVYLQVPEMLALQVPATFRTISFGTTSYLYYH